MAFPGAAALSRLNTMLIPYLKYRTPKYILVEVPIVSIIHRLCQMGALIYVIYSMVVGNLWAMASVPLGSTNPWIEGGDYSNVARDAPDYAHDKPGGFKYCSNPEFAYDYGGGWLYGTFEVPPICNSPNRHTITQKTVNSVFVTTAYIESTEHGFPCSAISCTATPCDAADAAANADADKATCTNYTGADSTLVTNANGQCVCTGPSRTFYPLAAEEMALSFAHFYNTKILGTSEEISGGSDNIYAKHPLLTTFIRADDTEKVWEPPSEITITLKDLLASAMHASCQEGKPSDMRDGVRDGKCAMGISLDEPNVDVRAEIDADVEASSGEPVERNYTRPAGLHYPTFRTTGASIELDITYTNMKNKRAQAENEGLVKTTIKATVQTGAWSSVGATATYDVYPTGEAGAQTWKLLSRYKQGVMVNMKSSGTLYTFNFMFLVQALVTGLVLLKVANTIADLVAFNLLPGGQSLVLANKRAETVSKKSEFAETGLKAALAAFQFGFFDRDRNGTVESVDICRAFANIETAEGKPAVTAEEAHAIATAIMEDADTDNTSCGALDFSEFMTCIEGDGIAFGDFLKKLKTRKDLEDYKDCLASYDAQRDVVNKEKASVTKRKSFSERHPSMAAQMKEDSLKPGARRASALGQEASGPIRRSLFKQSSSKAGETAVDPASASTELASRV